MEELIRQGKKAAVIVKKTKRRRPEIVLPHIDPRFEHIKKAYDIHALSLRCNSSKCKKKVSKAILITENIVKSKKSRDLALLYLCEDHSKNMKKFESELNQLSKGSMISVTTSDKK